MHRTTLPGWVDPSIAFDALYGGLSHAFWLDCGPDAAAGVSYMGAPDIGARVVTASVSGARVSIQHHGISSAPEHMHGSVFDFMKLQLPTAQREPQPLAVQSQHTLPSFALGWVGWLGYELAAVTVGTPIHRSPTPDAALLEIDRALAFDHSARSVTLMLRGEQLELEQWRDEIELVLASAVSAASAALKTPVIQAPSGITTAHWRHSPERYAEMIVECQAAIHRGDAYQLCLTNEITVDAHPDPLAAYGALRASSPTHHGGLMRFGDVSLLSASPEQFLAVSASGHMTTKPIKGTRRRASSLARDLELRTELEASEKERAENLMIVDLMRNDLGKVAKLGSVGVSSLLMVESYAHVHQLVSTIEAQLADGLRGIDAVEASFPAGSMTGAPKISAMRILDGLEAGPRGIYSGAFGYFGLDGAVDLAMVIRSIVLDASGARIGTGGGITALSVAAEEIEETQIKANALLAVLGAAGEMPDSI